MPCVAFLHTDRTADTDGAANANANANGLGAESDIVVEESMMPRLDAREVAAVFSARLHNFLRTTDMPPPPGSGQVLPEGDFYDGFWHGYKEFPWRVHNFYVPVNNQRVIKPRRRRRSSVASVQADDEKAGAQEVLADNLDEDGRFKVWGMTARVLVDAARIAYDEEPEMEHNDDLGDGKIIAVAEQEGSLKDESDKGKM